MGLVMEAGSALALIMFALWLFSLYQSAVRDRSAAQKRLQEEQEAQAQAEREARLYRKGEKLRCLDCGETFVGPMPDTGCPRCHLATLVVAERDYREPPHAAPTIGFRRKGN